MIDLARGETSGTAHGRPAITAGYARSRPRFYWRQETPDHAIAMSSLDARDASGPLPPVVTYSGETVSQATQDVQTAGTSGELVLSDGSNSQQLLIWNGRGGTPAVIDTPDRSGRGALAHLRGNFYVAAWPTDAGQTIELRALQCVTDCGGGSCTATTCCAVGRNTFESGASFSLLAAAAMPGAGFVVTAQIPSGDRYSWVLLFFGEDLRAIRSSLAPLRTTAPARRYQDMQIVRFAGPPPYEEIVFVTAVDGPLATTEGDALRTAIIRGCL